IIVAFVSSVSVVLPTFPLSAIVVFAVAMKMHPIIIAICAGFGSATGELTGYLIGMGGKKTILKKYKNKIQKLEKMFEKYRGGVVIFFFSFLPIVPIDVMGVFAGTVGYGVKKFYIACLAGKICRYLLIVTMTYYGIGVASSYFGFIF
ncbi:MAG: VTT domain-containing protein, partial [Nanoarchaeota archaeon]|nr:VTT domain-containing protein [Nanoarchaeota archaeon]